MPLHEATVGTRRCVGYVSAPGFGVQTAVSRVTSGGSAGPSRGGVAVSAMQTCLRLPPEPQSVRQAREHVRNTLEEAGRDQWVDDAALAVSELVSNVVLHAGTDCELSVSVSWDWPG